MSRKNKPSSAYYDAMAEIMAEMKARETSDAYEAEQEEHIDPAKLFAGRRYVQYSANNSGGSDWMTRQNWEDLERDGWIVQWDFSNGRGLPYCGYLPDVGLDEAMDRWSSVTAMDPSEEGCDCCGPPHNFSAYNEKHEYTFN